MIKKLQKAIQERGFQIYDIALMDKNGIQEAICMPCNRLNNSYSIAKIFINTLIGMLIEENVLHLDDKITSLLDSNLCYPYDEIWNEVRLYHLLNHKIGLSQGYFDIDRDDPQIYQTTDYLHYIFLNSPTKNPGEFYLYTDISHYLLSRIISQKTGRPADELIQKRICNPLQFYPSAWQRCPQGYTIGSTGAFLRSQDMVKLAWIYQNQGEYMKKRFISESWIQLSETEPFDLYSIRGGLFIGKAGINGQMLLYSRLLGLSVAWHGFEKDEKGVRDLILNILSEV